MKKRNDTRQTVLLWAAIVLMLLGGCSASIGAQPTNDDVTPEPTKSARSTTQPSEPAKAPKAMLADGVYNAEFKTDSSMFHVNEANNGKGVLTVLDGEMTFHISMPSKNIVNLFPGTAEDARKEGAAILIPTIDTVTYSDGTTEEVNGFDVVVPALDEEFALALVGTKGKWYDHMVLVTNPVLAE